MVCFSFKQSQFWISWKHGRLALGYGSAVGLQEIVAHSVDIEVTQLTFASDTVAMRWSITPTPVEYVEGKQYTQTQPTGSNK